MNRADFFLAQLDEDSPVKDYIRELWALSLDKLKSMADDACKNTYGDEVYLRGLIEYTNVCRMDCLYCGIRKSNDKVNRYRLDEDSILAAVEEGYGRGFRTFVLQGGEDPEWPAERLARLVAKIKELCNYEVAVTLSSGLMTKDDYVILRDAGADRYLMRFETADSKLHERLRGGISLRRRIQALLDMRDAGFELGSGFMCGLPGEDDEVMLKNLYLCKLLELDMIGIGPFIPHPDTPLKDAPQLGLERTLKAEAILRIILPGANLPATTAAGSLQPDGRERMLECGANVLMPNLTPVIHKKDYLLYPGKICLDEDGFKCVSCLSLRVASVGKKIVWDIGTSKNYKERNGHVSRT
ncbi:[FeFe] hydrogenase H-cluster radical SAM maturase HydE [Spirochaetia bacterium 38H-sp]|uniref:[FeFe] hydrogenase H-cluster radical SAM maturase HydE n=1 Tax=Rarispira pelagica TaxID=3141764 RepID=A0ABU9UED2_9SPIR